MRYRQMSQSAHPSMTALAILPGALFCTFLLTMPCVPLTPPGAVCNRAGPNAGVIYNNIVIYSQGFFSSPAAPGVYRRRRALGSSL